MGLPTDLVRFFYMGTLCNDLQKAGKKIPSAPQPRSLGDFFRNTSHDSRLVMEAASICRRLIGAGVLTSAGSRNQGSPPYNECYWSLGFKSELVAFPYYEFLAYGFTAIYQHFASAVLPLVVENASGDPDIGTCFLLANRMIVTARHCIENMNSATIKGWSPASASLAAIHVYADTRVDLAILQFDKDPFPGLPGFLFEHPKILDSVMTLGYPQIQGFDAPLIAETSQVAAILKSSLGIVVNQSPSYLDSQDYLLISARVKGGNSGGPVIGKKGGVLGVVTHLPAEDYGRPDLLGYAAALPETLIDKLVHLSSQKGEEVTTMKFQLTDRGFSTNI